MSRTTQLALALLTVAATAAFAGAADAVPAALRNPDRASVDRPDTAGDYQIHVIYLVPSDAADRRLDVDPRVHGSISAMQEWLASRMPGRLRWNMDDHRGRTDITFLRGRLETAKYDLFTLRDELADRGFDQARTLKRYLVLLDGDSAATGFCGESEYPVYGLSTYTGQTSGARLGGSVAVVRVDAVDACHNLDHGSARKPGYFPAVMLHELIHTEGLVAPGAPHACRETVIGAHICTFGPLAFQPSVAAVDPEASDVMFPAPTGPLAVKTLDAGGDDYLGGTAVALRLGDSAYLTGPGRRASARGTLPPISPQRILMHGDHSH